MVGNYIHVIDYDEFSGIGLVEILSRIEGKYRYGSFILPHDINVRDYTTGVSRLNAFWERDLDAQPLATMKVADTIYAARVNFPRVKIDPDRCKLGIERLKNCRYQFEARTQTILDKVVHDQNSHGFDAWRYGMSWILQNYGEQSGSGKSGMGSAPTMEELGIEPTPDHFYE
jgi:hypothetical protein